MLVKVDLTDGVLNFDDVLRYLSRIDATLWDTQCSPSFLASVRRGGN